MCMILDCEKKSDQLKGNFANKCITLLPLPKSVQIEFYGKDSVYNGWDARYLSIPLDPINWLWQQDTVKCPPNRGGDFFTCIHK